MARLKRDERICPMCGETIKSVAVRCRYCHADVEPQAILDPSARSGSKIQRKMPAESADSTPVVLAKAASKDVATEEPSSDSPPPPTARPKRPAPTLQSLSDSLRTNLTVVLAGLVILASVGVGVSWWRAEQPSEVAPSGALVGETGRTQILVEGADLAQRALSYNYKTLDNDMEVARARMTPAFQKEYDATMAQVRDNTTKNQITLQATVVSSAIISATENDAKVLLFLNQTTESGTTKEQQLSRNSLVVTLTRGDGDWMMSKLTALG